MLDPQIIPLHYLCSIAGLIMVAGGIFLIYKEKIYIDRETKKVTEVETPIGKFKTNAPALVLFVLGFFPLIYPIYMAKEGSKMVSISGELSSTNYPVNVYAVVKSESLLNDGSYRLMVPARSENDKYKLIFYSHNIFIEDIADLKGIENDDIRIGKKNIIVPKNSLTFKKKIIEVPSDF